MKSIKLFFVLSLMSIHWLKAQDSPLDFRVEPADQLYLDVLIDFPSCPGMCDAAVWVEVSGGQPPYSFSWFNGLTGTEYLNACAGIGSVTVTDAVGDTAAVQFYVLDPISPTLYFTNLIITQPTGGQSNGSIAMDSMMIIIDTTFLNPDSLWSLDSIHFTPYYIFPHLGPGIYHLYIKPLFGCTIRAGNEIILYDVTAVEDLTLSFDLYPNPVSDILQLSADIPLSLELYDMQGKRWLTSDAKRYQQISVAEFPDGMYVLKISDGERNTFRKIVKN